MTSFGEMSLQMIVLLNAKQLRVGAAYNSAAIVAAIKLWTLIERFFHSIAVQV